MGTTCGQNRSLLTWVFLADVRSEFIAACASVIALVAALGVPASAQEAITPVAARARLTGVVFDSIGTRPLAGAIVRLVLSTDRTTGRTATTGSDGGFVHDSVPAGTWLATFLHPVLDSLGLEPPLVRIDVRDAGVDRALRGVWGTGQFHRPGSRLARERQHGDDRGRRSTFRTGATRLCRRDG